MKTNKKTRRSKADNVWYIDKGYPRRKQIHGFFIEECGSNYILQNQLNKVLESMVIGNIKEAFKRLDYLVLLHDRKGTTSGYLIMENINQFGKQVVLKDLAEGIFMLQLKSKVKRNLIEKAYVKRTSKTLDEFEKERKEDEKKRKKTFGTTKDKEKKSGILVMIKKGIKQIPQLILVDKKTKKKLKPSKSMQKEIDKRNKILKEKHIRKRKMETIKKPKGKFVLSTKNGTPVMTYVNINTGQPIQLTQEQKERLIKINALLKEGL